MRITTVAPLVAATMTAGAQISNGKMPKLRLAIAGVAGAVMLSVAANWLPEVARAFAVLIILGTLIGPGYDLVRSLNRLVNQ